MSNPPIVDRVPVETMDDIFSFMSSQTLSSATRVSKRWYACSFGWAHRRITIPDAATFGTAFAFWDGVVSCGTDQSSVEPWNVVSVGRERMLATPRAVTIGQEVSGGISRAAPDDRTFDDLDDLFLLLNAFPNVTELTLRAIPKFSFTRLPYLLALLPNLLSLAIESTPRSDRLSWTGQRHTTVLPLFSSTLRSVSLFGLRSSVLSRAEWEVLLLLAEAPSVRVLEFDLRTWKSFYGHWASSARVGKRRYLRMHCSEDGRALFLVGNGSLESFRLLPDVQACSLRAPPQSCTLLKDVGIYLRRSAQSLRSLNVLPGKGEVGVPHGALWKPFNQLVQFVGSPQSFQHVDHPTLIWESVAFVGDGGFSVIGSGRFGGLRRLVITVADDRDIPFVVGCCPHLESLRMTVRRGDVIALYNSKSLTCISLGFSAIVHLQICFWREVGVGQAYQIFEEWVRLFPLSMKTLQFSHVLNDFVLKWKRVRTAQPQWVEVFQNA
ncbi:hypothetical protein PM082_023037 [Marasmius tenuissimus]|nr:hypothetical protein PM082_023037 [Marasmius tenuissimus]